MQSRIRNIFSVVIFFVLSSNVFANGHVWPTIIHVMGDEASEFDLSAASRMSADFIDDIFSYKPSDLICSVTSHGTTECSNKDADHAHTKKMCFEGQIKSVCPILMFAFRIWSDNYKEGDHNGGWLISCFKDPSAHVIRYTYKMRHDYSNKDEPDSIFVTNSMEACQ